MGFQVEMQHSQYSVYCDFGIHYINKPDYINVEKPSPQTSATWKTVATVVFTHSPYWKERLSPELLLPSYFHNYIITLFDSIAI